MPNFRLDLTYDGTGYSGFQIQYNAPTVQGVLEEALERLYRQRIRITGAGRTDAGVHARGQVVNYQGPPRVPPDRLPAALNSLLPGDVVVTAAGEVPADFHARYSASGKLYSYTLDRAAYPQVLLRLYSWHCPGPLDVEAMREAARILQGTHDFKAFRAEGSSVLNTVRTLRRLELVKEDYILRLLFEADGFLYRMVRLITGSLVRVGQGRLQPSDIAGALAGVNPRAAGPTAPARGLCLEKVYY